MKYAVVTSRATVKNKAAIRAVDICGIWTRAAWCGLTFEFTRVRRLA
jgi:hypothetical protein